MLDKRIKFEEECIIKEHNTITFYFIAPKNILGNKYPEAEHAEISIECPITHIEADYAYVMVSPTKDGFDYDWNDYNIQVEEIEEFIKLAHYSGNTN